MPSDPAKLLAFCSAIAETSEDELAVLDRDELIATASTLEDLRRTIDKALLRLSFLKERQLN
jgi:hypothetical protein